jgi:hypothetical protein
LAGFTELAWFFKEFGGLGRENRGFLLFSPGFLEEWGGNINHGGPGVSRRRTE